MIDFGFTKQEEKFRDEIILFTKTHCNDGVTERDRNQKFDRNLWSEAGKLALPGLPIPEQYGGAGLSIIATMHALEALGYGCEDNGLSFAIGAHLLSCVVPIWLHGSPAQKQALLPKLSTGQWIAANAMTEASGGSDAFNMQSEGQMHNEHYSLKGEKVYVSNAPLADLVVTYVMTDKIKGKLGGISCFLLEKGQFDTSAPIDKMGLRSCMMGKVVLNDTLINQSQMLGKPGAGLMIFNQSMMWERIGLSAMHLGTLQRLFERTVSFAKGNQTGRSLKTYQAVTHKLADIQASLTAARWATYYAAWCLGEKNKAGLYASVAKLQASELYKTACSDLLQIWGAAGYVNNHEIERTLRDAVASTLYSGSSEIQRNLIFGALKGGA